MRMSPLLLTAALLSPMLSADDLSVPVLVKFVKVIVDSTGGGKFQCLDSSLKGAFDAAGLPSDPTGGVAFCNNPVQAKMLVAGGRLVVSSRRDMTANAAIVVTADAGKPKFLVNPGLIRKARVQVGDAILRLAEQH